MKVYLAGYISGKMLKECTEWRIKIREHYAKMDWNICWLDPLNGKEFATITADGMKSAVPGSALTDRDWMSVSNADLIVANMDTFGEVRPPIGTLCELAWAWTMRKPIIMITKETWYKEHPFMQEFVSWYVPDVETLIKEKLINYFYKGLNTAVYTEDIYS